MYFNVHKSPSCSLSELLEIKKLWGKRNSIRNEDYFLQVGSNYICNISVFISKQTNLKDIRKGLNAHPICIRKCPVTFCSGVPITLAYIIVNNPTRNP